MPPSTAFRSLLNLLTLSTFITFASASPSYHPHLSRRDIISSSDLSSSYDYIIAGGGLAGLVLASRLSEDDGVTVLVLEAGASGDDAKQQIDPPSGAYYSSIVNTGYDWAHQTVPQTSLANRVIGWPRGKVLGGSTAMNAMYLVRPASVELDAWSEMLGSMDDDGSGVDASTYNWQNMFAAMRKAENFTAPLEEVQRIGNIKFNGDNYGKDGPMQITWPAAQISVTGNWTSTLSSIGVSELEAPNGGTTLGGFITPSSINPSNWTRSYSRSAYIDPLPPRSNLHILPNALVTRIVFSDTREDGKLVATGVEYAENEQAPRHTISLKREAILAGGPVGSPKILMHSGVGPKDVLEAAGVGVIEELPGVGQHLQDHVTGGISWQADFETAGDIEAAQSDFARTPEFQSVINNAIAFVNLSSLFSHSQEAITAIQSEIAGAMDSSADTLVPSQYSEVKEGYKVIYKVNSDKFLGEMAQLELLLSVIGQNTVNIQTALQHPFSTGRLYINSTNPFDQAIIDPQYFSHPADITMLRQGLKLARTLGQAFQAQSLFGEEIYPGPEVQTDQDWENWLRNEGAGTQYHPTASCVMLPSSLGGVVDKSMTVHGLANVRIMDSSVYPFEFAAHLASATFGLAEQGASLLKQNSFSSAALSTSNAGTASARTAVLSTMLFLLWQLLSFI